MDVNHAISASKAKEAFDQWRAAQDRLKLLQDAFKQAASRHSTGLAPFPDDLFGQLETQKRGADELFVKATSALLAISHRR